jgi:hypothetical protein
MVLDETLHRAVTAAFNRGWRQLLKEERVTAKNIDTIAGALLAGIFRAAQNGQLNEIVLLAEGMEHVKLAEADGWRTTDQTLRPRLH